MRIKIRNKEQKRRDNWKKINSWQPFFAIKPRRCHVQPTTQNSTDKLPEIVFFEKMYRKAYTNFDTYDLGTYFKKGGKLAIEWRYATFEQFMQMEGRDLGK
jgi:hypothetical protein